MFRTACLLLVLLASAVRPVRAAVASPVRELARSHSGLDLDRDGEPEIVSLQPLPGLAPFATPHRPLVLLLVESRLLQPLPDDPAGTDLTTALRTWHDDLRAEGYDAAVIATRLYPGPRHQDGLTLLALRRFLQAVHSRCPSLEGVVLVGAFPDALLVRTCNWRKRGRVVLRKGQPDERRFDNVPYLRSVPEVVARRCDLVLADLDGHWERLYTQPLERLTGLLAVFPDGVPPHGGLAADLAFTHRRVRDYFHVNDGRWSTRERLDPATGAVTGTVVEPVDTAVDEECTDLDRSARNPIARPELCVSRIDARGVALAPPADARGAALARLSRWRFDPRLERRLLRSYFARNHAYRTGSFPPEAWRPAAIAADLPNGWRAVRRGHPRWHALEQPRAFRGRAATPLTFARWLARPAVVRDIRAHTDPRGSNLHRVPAAQMLRALGTRARWPPPVWQWSERPLRRLDFFLLHSLWGLGRSPKVGWIGLHTGCDVTSPPGATRFDYRDPRYLQGQAADALLFYGGALAICGRAKVFYDAPTGFYETLAHGGTIGAAWRRYFTEEAQRRISPISRKRAYFWNVTGDWTLRLPPPPISRTPAGSTGRP